MLTPDIRAIIDLDTIKSAICYSNFEDLADGGEPSPSKRNGIYGLGILESHNLVAELSRPTPHPHPQLLESRHFWSPEIWLRTSASDPPLRPTAELILPINIFEGVCLLHTSVILESCV